MKKVKKQWKKNEKKKPIHFCSERHYEF